MFDGLTSSFRKVIEKIRGGGRLTEENLTDAVRMIRQALLEADVNLKVARAFCERVKQAAIGQELIQRISPDQQFVHIVHHELVALMSPPPDDDKPVTFVSGRPTVIMVVGLNGAGKTTTTGKLGLLLRKQYKKDPLLVAADLARPAAIEQLEIIGQRLEIPVFKAADPKKSNPVKVCQDAIVEAKKTARDVVILDTAGRIQIDELLMKELEEIKSKVKPDHILLVVDGMTGQDAANSAKVFNDRLDAHGVILTKLDGDTRGGAALSVREVTGKPIRFIGTGEHSENFEAFRPEGMAERILGMGDIVSLIDEVQGKIDQEKAEEQMTKIFMSEFSLEDFLSQLEMIQSLGPLKGLLGKLPAGALGLPEGAMDDFDEREILKIKAIIQSMTPKERFKADLIDASRKRRIAIGSGTSVEQVNELLKSFKTMQKQFKEMTKSGGIMGKIARSHITRQKKKTLKDEAKGKKRKPKRW
ncbi:MAG: signal recognition particle protein [Planctomycetota bacterium]